MAFKIPSATVPERIPYSGNIILLGSASVGKSNLMNRFLTGKFIDTYLTYFKSDNKEHHSNEDNKEKTSKNFGKISIIGTNKSTCLSKLKNMDFFASPIDWK